MLALALGLGIQPAAGEEGLVREDKRLYDDHPLYIDLDLDPAESTDDDNFVVMQEGSVILYAESGMRIVAAEDKTSYTLYNPTSEALGIAPGTPVAFIDPAIRKPISSCPPRLRPNRTASSLRAARRSWSRNTFLPKSV